MAEGFAIVVDIGKTLSKVSLWSRDARMLDRKVRPNAVVEQGGVRRLDVAGIAGFVEAALASHAGQPVETIVPVAHGAAIAALHEDRLAFAPLDYEQPVPPAVSAAYETERDPFALTGSPALPGGLNAGRQLAWLEQLHPRAMEAAALLPWAQYWAWFLSGAAASEVTSLGCHSDLWHPAARDFAPLARRRGWAERFAPMADAGDAIGTLRPELARRTGLPARTKVLAGLHDSNAALLAARGFPEIADNEATVLSTGTWFVAMRSVAGDAGPAALPEALDCLINVDVSGRPVPSARWMGGREIELLGARIDRPGTAGLADALLDHTMILPCQVAGCGPFPHTFGRWINRTGDADADAAAVALYAALMTDASLDLIGARDRLLVEGRFAASELYVRALATLRPATQVLTAGSETDAAFGALRLACPDLAPPGALTRVVPFDRTLDAYRDEWHEDLAAFA